MSRRSGIFSPLFRVATGLAATAALEVANPLVAAAAVAPSKPLAVTASPGDTAARVTWSAPASDGGATITAYKAIASPGGRSCTIGGTDLSCLVRGLADGTAYSFKVKAQTEAGWGKSSTPSLAVVPVHHTAAYLGSQGKKFYAVGLSDHSQLWSQSPSADVNAVALVSGTTLFWGDDANTLHAVDLADPGHPELWTYTASLCFQEQGMAVSGTTLLALSADGVLHALDIPTGEQLWSFSTGGQLWESNIVVDGSGHVYVAGADAVLHRIDVATGVEQGSVPTGSAFDAALAFSGGNVLIPTQQGSDPMALSSYDVTGGSLNWIRTVPGATDILSAPVVKGGTVYVATGDGKVVAVDTATGATRWTRQLSASISWGLEVHKDSIFVGTDDGNVWSLKTSDGSKIWKVKPSGATYWSTPTYFKKAVYLGSGSGALVGLDAATGSTKWSFVTAGDAQYNRPVIW